MPGMSDLVAGRRTDPRVVAFAATGSTRPGVGFAVLQVYRGSPVRPGRECGACRARHCRPANAYRRLERVAAYCSALSPLTRSLRFDERSKVTTITLYGGWAAATGGRDAIQVTIYATRLNT